MSVDSFMTEFTSVTQPNPNRAQELLWRDKVGFTVKPLPSMGTVRLLNIRSIIPSGSGIGTEALLWLTSLAEVHQISIVGEAEPTGFEDRLNHTDLRAWYRRHGFTVSSRGDIEYVPRNLR